MVKKFHVDMTQGAERDLRSIHDHIAQDKPRAASKWLRECRRRILGLELFPFRCEIIPEDTEFDEEYRHLIHGNYRAIFKVEGNKVRIVRIIHAARLLTPGFLP